MEAVTDLHSRICSAWQLVQDIPNLRILQTVAEYVKALAGNRVCGVEKLYWIIIDATNAADGDFAVQLLPDVKYCRFRQCVLCANHKIKGVLFTQ